MNEQPNNRRPAGKQDRRPKRGAQPGQAKVAPAKAAAADREANGQGGTAKPAQKEQRGRRPARPQNSFVARRQEQPRQVPLQIYPLGGLGEIGKNMTVLECGGDMLVVDCGGLFPDTDMFGVDLVIPDFTFLEQNQDKIRGVLITHGHEDHIGALPYFLREMNIPLYATRLTLGLIQNKLEEHGLWRSTETHLIAPREKLQLGCFTIDPIHVNHSIPDSVAFAIECPAGIVVMTGDFKIDYTPIGGGVADLSTFSDYGEKGVLVLLSDSTNSERPGMSASESRVNEGLSSLFNRADKQRIIVATFASNLYRVQQLVDLAVKKGRKVAISGRSMINNTQMAMELGYLKVPDGVLIDVDKINKVPPDQVVLITTGSQGETLSALSRMAAGSHRNVHVGPGDYIIISATPIPGNEKMVTRVVNGLLRAGAEVIYENMYDVHASGHACQDEQKMILSLVKPKYFIPVHGEYKHLKRHAMTAQALGVPEQNILVADTGDEILIDDKGIRAVGTVPAGAVMVDGLGVGDVGSVVLRDRRLLSQDGIMVIAATVEKRSGRLINGPEIFSRGFVYVRESEELMEDARMEVVKLLQENPQNQHHDVNSLKTRLREAVSSFLYRRTKRSPMILPVVMEV